MDQRNDPHGPPTRSLAAFLRSVCRGGASPVISLWSYSYDSQDSRRFAMPPNNVQLMTSLRTSLIVAATLATASACTTTTTTKVDILPSPSGLAVIPAGSGWLGD